MDGNGCNQNDADVPDHGHRDCSTHLWSQHWDDRGIMNRIQADVMVNPSWYVVAWLVVAAAAAWKFWRLTGAYRKNIDISTYESQSLSSFKDQLERSWQRDKAR